MDLIVTSYDAIRRGSNLAKSIEMSAGGSCCRNGGGRVFARETH